MCKNDKGGVSHKVRN